MGEENTQKSLETVSKRNFLKRVGASAVALSSVGAAKATTGDPSPEYYCETKVLADDTGGTTCHGEIDQDVFDEVVVRFHVERSSGGSEIADFCVYNGSTATCDMSEMDEIYKVTEDTVTIEHTYTDPDPEISVFVDHNIDTNLVYDIELEQCIY